MKHIDLIILAGGRGTRLHSISHGVPKALMPIGKQVFLDILLKNIFQHSIRNIYLSLYYKPEYFIDYLKRSQYSKYITPIVEPVPLGTGGAVKYVISNTDITSQFYVINGDSLSSINLDEMQRKYNSSNFKSLVGVSQVTNSNRYGTVNIYEDLVTEFVEKGNMSNGWINNGHYLLGTESLAGYEDAFSIEKTLFPNLVKNKQLGVYKVHNDDFIDIGVPRDYQTLLEKYREMD